METTSEEITALVGREVYSNNGVFVGEVEDVRLNLDNQKVTGLALHELNPELFSGYVGDSRGVLIPYRWVRSVGDVVLINDIIERLRPREDDGADEVVVSAVDLLFDAPSQSRAFPFRHHARDRRSGPGVGAAAGRAGRRSPLVDLRGRSPDALYVTHYQIFWK